MFATSSTRVEAFLQISACPSVISHCESKVTEEAVKLSMDTQIGGYSNTC